MTILFSTGASIDGQKLWDADHAPSNMHELNVWGVDLDADDPDQRDRIIQVYQNLNLARLAELSNAQLKAQKRLIMIGWIVVVLLLISILTSIG